jgi:large subunit ribosomal protein L13
LKGKVVGNWAPLIIERLRGKDRLDFFPGLDLGGVVVIINAKEAFFTEKELNQVKHHHSGYPGGLKTETIRLMLEKSPRNLTFRIIKGMMPLGKLGKKQLGRLFIYPDGSHLHKAQERGFIPLTSKKI